MTRLLFVCSGNTCRSPLAEAIGREVSSRSGRRDIEASSAGTHAHPGSPASDGALLVGIEEGLDLSTHRARQLTPEILDASDLILVMAHSHLAKVLEMRPDANAHLLAGFATSGPGASVQDPFGGDLELYRETYEIIEREVGAVLAMLPPG
ncbi:MAG: low molecular weight protein arginine phosphatase [Gemmatimonadaceae bacterium]